MTIKELRQKRQGRHGAKNTRKRTARCAGSGTKSTGWPGDQYRCPTCERWVVVKQDGTFRSH